MDNLNKKFLMEYIDEIQGELRDISDKIWKIQNFSIKNTMLQIYKKNV